MKNDNKVVDLTNYRIEKELRELGFDVKRDESNKVKVVIKLNGQR